MRYPLFLCVLVLSSCAKENSDDGQFIATDDLAAAVAYASSASVACQPGETCSLSVGSLTGAESDGAYQCTASLVSPDTVVTNSHCVPADLKAEGSSCAGRVWMNFPQEKGYETRTECERVIFASEKSGSGDYAYLKLKTPSRRPYFRFSRDGIFEDEQYSLHKMTPVRVPGKLFGRISRDHCRPIYDSEMKPGLFFLSPEILMTDCAVVHGNSGSPLIAPDGTLRGVISSYYEVEEFREFLLKKENVRVAEDLANLNGASNFSCLRAPDNSPPADACSDPFANVTNTFSARFSERILGLTAAVKKESVTSAFGNWAPAPSQTYTTGEVLEGKLSCVRADATANAEVDLPRWRIVENYDGFFRSNLALEKIEPQRRALSADEIGATPLCR